MLIDWFTVAAQAVNFLILVWLLKRFLYKPILDAIDAREQRIAAELADADQKRAEARLERDEFQLKNQTFEQQRQEMLNKAVDEATTQRQQLMEDAKTAAETLRIKREESLRRDHEALSAEIVRRTRDEVFAIAQKALADLADSSLEASMINVFTERLQTLEDADKKNFAGTVDALPCSMIVRSAFDLQTPQRTAIQNAINNTFSSEVSLKFEASPDVISGIELTANGHKLSWSIAEYLVSMEQRLGELLPGNNMSQHSSGQDIPAEQKLPL